MRLRNYTSTAVISGSVRSGLQVCRRVMPSVTERAFTMVEIALSIAVVAFALVAIVGVLPTGLSVQRDNREDTIIQQEGAYFLEAIRSGATNLTELTNYVDSVTISNWVQGSRMWTNSGNNIQMDGREIIGLLSTPKFLLFGNKVVTNNLVAARIRALSGAAIEKPAFFTKPTASAKDFAFSYLLTSEIVQLPSPLFSGNEGLRRAYLTNRAWEVRLTFRWPLLPNGNTGGGRKTFRALLPGALEPVRKNATNRYDLYRFATSEFEFSD